MNKLLLGLFYLNMSLAQDQFYKYQWAHENTGKKVPYRTSFDDVEIKETKEGFDLGLKAFHESKLKPKKDVIVAVIGTGVSYDHPDLKENIYRNLQECDEKGNPKYLVDEDADKNGYPGDCVGWNFASFTDAEIEKFLNAKKFAHLSSSFKNNFRKELKQMRRVPFDSDGHETHISGIMSAVRGNSIGVAGISNRIKILPIKVYNSLNNLLGSFVEVQSGNETRRKPMDVVLTQAIRYAMTMKVDVINLSLGWNKSSHSATLEKTINAALAQNISIVTSSDNSGSNDSTFPCRIPGVICVGATNAFGSLSEFSNYGHNVEVLAPGEKILSLYPQSIDPLEFSITGYEYASGTSQATPFVSGFVALLKSIHPEFTHKDIKRVLLNSTQSVKSKGTISASLGGMIDFSKMESALKSTKRNVFPSFKYKQSFIYEEKSKSIEGFFVLENLSSKTESVKLKVESVSPSFKLNNSVSLKAYEGKKIDLKINVDSLKGISSLLKLNVNINSQKYVVEIPVYRLLDLETLNKAQMSERDSAKILETVSRSFEQVLNFSKESKEYYGISVVERKGLEVSLFEESNGSFENTHSVLIDKANKILSVMHLDLNADQVKDYLVFTLHQVKVEGNENQLETYWQYSYFDKNLKPLFGENSFFQYVPTSATFKDIKDDYDNRTFTMPRNPKDIGFVTQSVDGIGNISFPVFFAGNSFVPIHQQRKNSFSRFNDEPGDHVFYLKLEKNNGKNYLVTYSFFDEAFNKKISPYSYRLSELKVLGTLKESTGCQRGVCTQFLVMSGRGYYKKVHLLTVGKNFKYSLEEVSGDYWNLAGFSKREELVWSKDVVTTQDFLQVSEGNIFFEFKYDDEKKSLETFEVKKDKFSSYYPIASFRKEESQFDIYFKNNEVSLFDKQKNTWREFDWKRYSFIDPSREVALLESSFVKTKEGERPALFWNAQGLTEDSYRLAVFNESKIDFPLEFAFKTPRGCQKLLIRFNTEKRYFEIPFVCKDRTREKAFSLYSLPLIN